MRSSEKGKKAKVKLTYIKHVDILVTIILNTVFQGSRVKLMAY